MLLLGKSDTTFDTCFSPLQLIGLSLYPYVGKCTNGTSDRSDWMSECTMSWHGAAKHELRQKGISDAERVGLFDPSFMDTFTPALPHIQEKGIKVAVNAGASDTEMLAKLVEKVVKEKGLSLKVAWIQGDDVMDVVNRLMEQGEKFENICFGGELKDWGHEPLLAAQCYLGSINSDLYLRTWTSR
jgi:hypothetical protein